MLKTYQSKKFLKRSVNIDVDGIERVVTFTGGMMYPKKVCGVYSTKDIKEQKALESHPGFGSKFVLINEEKPEKEEVKPIDLVTEEVEEVVETVEEETEEVTEEVDEVNDKVVNEEVQEEVVEEQTEESQEETIEKVEEGIKEVFEVENSQQAKNYLMKEYPNEFTHRQLGNKNMILAAAKEKNISFPNVK